MAGRKESQELFQLIKSMTPEEKGYFKKYAQRHSNNESESLKLFNLVDKQESYNEQCLKSQINHLPVVKSNLLEQLLQALLISNSTPSLNQIINKNIAYSEILYDRGLQRKALQLAKETFQLAIANDLIDRALVVHHIIENMRVGTLRQSERWQSIHTYFDTSSKLADLLKALSKYHLEERKMTFINRENEREKAAKLLSSIDIKFLEDKTNLAIPKFHFSRTVSLFGYYYASNRLDKMYIVSKEGLDYCREVYLKQLSQSRAVSYMVALFNHQDVAIEAGDLNGVLTELANLEKLRINSKPIDDVIIQFQSIRMHQEVFLFSGEFEKGLKYSQKVFKEIKVDEKSKIHPHIYAVLLGQQSVLCLLSKNYQAAYLSLQKLYDFDKSDKDVLQEASIHFLEAIIHYESGDLVSMKKQIQVIKKFNTKNSLDLLHLIKSLEKVAQGIKDVSCSEEYVLMHRIKLNDWFRSITNNIPLNQVVRETNKNTIKERRVKAKL